MRSDDDIEQAITRYGDAVLRACRAVLPRTHEAEDAFQDVFLRYASRDEPFNGEGHRKAWLLRVAINLSRDRLRRASERDVALDAISDPSIPPEDERIAQRMAMQDALAELSVDQRTAILLSVVEGYPARDVARFMGKSENTVYSLIARGKKKLKEVLVR
ncbi:RNA polymerase sigma factor [Curtanaerobium respiraculi]|uniref:RNA polymerase sigma factor n=1 Tax=Curtanaerobium respiraculi TaxID=2949669 RepID=UPI0024B3830D|nr:sigma-70 family RNA polymerase sigma factor [Curtanaerobium respiraculi]